MNSPEVASFVNIVPIRYIVAAALFLCFSLSVSAGAAGKPFSSFIESFPNGKIDWLVQIGS